VAANSDKPARSRPQGSQPALAVSQPHLRRFLLQHQALLRPRQLQGAADILAFFSRVRSIQFDPIAVAGGNANLVLQSRVAQYRPAMLEQLLYGQRRLWDGWDKQAAIHRVEDWPYFGRYRRAFAAHYPDPTRPPLDIAGEIVSAIQERGPLSAIDLEHEGSIHWWWGRPARRGRAALEVLFGLGRLGISRRVGSRRYFDLVERLLPAEIVAAAEPNPGEAAYQEWHVERRIGGLGVADAAAGDHWLGIPGVKAAARHATIGRLVEQGRLLPLAVEGLNERPYYVRSVDLPRLEKAAEPDGEPPQVSFIAPLDNFIWNRRLLRELWGFDYTWEVFVPAERRRYGYYVLPVLYGERFVGRFAPAVDKKAGRLVIGGWWWEPGVEPDAALEEAVATALQEFAAYLGVAEPER
jgi:uncharacterized protein YcaQ